MYIKSKGPGGDKKIEEPLGTFKLPNRSTKRQEFDPDEPLGSRILAVVSLEGIECTSDYMIKTTQNRVSQPVLLLTTQCPLTSSLLLSAPPVVFTALAASE